MGDPYSIGIVGAGGISEAHLQAIKMEPRVYVQAIADVSLESAYSQAERHFIPHVYSDYHEMLEKDSIDIVIICTPNFLHAPVAIEALKSGKHVLTEKPMTIDVESAIEMKKIADQTGKILMVAQNNRFHGETLLLKRLIEQDKLGKIYHVETAWVRRNGIPGWGSWFTQKHLSGGGTLIDIGVHMLDLALWLIDFPKPISVLGKTFDIFGPHKRKIAQWGKVNDDGFFNVEDFAYAFIDFDNGSSLILETSWASHIKEDQAYVKLYGDKGGAEFNLLKKSVVLYTDNGQMPVDTLLKPSSEDDRYNTLKNFVDAIDGKAKLICKPEESIMIQQLLHAVYQSAETRKLVTFS